MKSYFVPAWKTSFVLDSANTMNADNSQNGTKTETPSLVLDICEFQESYFWTSSEKSSLMVCLRVGTLTRPI